MSQDLVTISSPELTAQVAPLGAELQSIQTTTGQDLLWNGDHAYWSGRAPILFPIVGRAPNDRISVGTFSAPMKQHGFARRSVFRLETQTQNMCRFVLTDNEATRAQYPFAFRLTVTHQITGATLESRVDLRNDSRMPMPFGFGFHPAFVWPLPNAKKAAPHTITLHNKGEPELARLTDGLLSPMRYPSPFTDGQLTLDHSQFDQDAMIFPTGAGTDLTYGASGATQLDFTFENLPNLAIWTKANAPFVCIEPWHGMAAQMQTSDQIADRPNTVTLAPDDSTTFAMTVTVQP
ncbi:galactose mutarotase-like enzyme [Pacificibacter maritimus]|uniref:Galactose mutarotase-like enzyme n=1 Tax=Pacificibacter maritimus TaxID=762213 RepID=A0A3N4U9D3_9RHOB|nr:aldose 1-epimerase family protein [Pacificibacter maritimus]RPE67346.1 galactose mutarotase-like enzyme [Pacificibacter maritimus]